MLIIKIFIVLIALIPIIYVIYKFIKNYFLDPFSISKHPHSSKDVLMAKILAILYLSLLIELSVSMVQIQRGLEIYNIQVAFSAILFCTIGIITFTSKIVIYTHRSFDGFTKSKWLAPIYSIIFFGMGILLWMLYFKNI